MTTTDDIRRRIVAACDAILEPREIPILADAIGWGVDWDDTTPYPLPTGVTPLGALIVHERLPPGPDGGMWWAESVINALGVDAAWLVWFCTGLDGADETPGADDVDAYNLGLEMRGRYVK